MSKKTTTEDTKLDLTQRICRAIQRTTDPVEQTGARPIEPHEEVIGKLPTHLRHFQNLLDELADEAKDAAIKASIAENHFDTARALFITTVVQHVSTDNPAASGLEICQDWQIVPMIRK